MAEKNHKKHTVVFIPDNKGRPFSVKLSPAIVKYAVFFLFVLAAGFLVLIWRAGDIAVRLQMNGVLRKENALLQKQNRQLMEVTARIDNIERLAAYLDNIASAAENDISSDIASSQSAAALDKVFSADSMDNLIEKIRREKSSEYDEMVSEDATPELLPGSIPNIKPVDGWMTQPFKTGRDLKGHSHAGVDFAAPTGSLIKATAPGTVEDISEDSYFGHSVIVKHNYGYKTRYCHCSQIVVSKGDVVDRGQTIALVGNSGKSTGPHLHYEVIRNGIPVDPVKYIVSTSVF